MKFRQAFIVRAPLQKVAAFYRDPRSLQAITPPIVPIRLRSAPAQLQQDDEIDLVLWLIGVPVHWVARVVTIDEQGFTDCQISGPFARWTHRHQFVPISANCTQIVDEIDAALSHHPLKALVGILLWLGLPLLFAYRRWKTRRLLEHPPLLRPSEGDVLR